MTSTTDDRDLPVAAGADAAPDSDDTSAEQVDLPAEFAGYDDLPAAARRTSPSDGPHTPRFDGDVSELPDRACWALQNLLTRRHISGERQPQLWAWVVEYADVLRVRLSELDLRLRIADELQVAFVEQAGYESRWGRRILKRETIHTYDAILALHLAKYLRAARDEHVLITRDEIHEMFASVTNTIDRDLALFDKRIERSIDKLAEMEFLRAHRDDPDTFTVSPVISAVMTASVITDLQRQFEQFISAGEEAVDADDSSAGAPGSSDDADRDRLDRDRDDDPEDGYTDEGDDW